MSLGVKGNHENDYIYDIYIYIPELLLDGTVTYRVCECVHRILL